MAVGKVFNAPPNWPAPPAGWQPPADWEPDPSWGPAPEGWDLYRRANPHPFLRSFGWGTAIFSVVIVLLLVTWGITDYAAGVLLATLVLMPGFATALILRSRKAYWPWWKVLLCVLAWAALFGVLQLIGAANDAAEQATKAPVR